VFDAPLIWFILGPVLVLAVVIGWLTRNDPYSIKAANKYKEGLKKSKLLHVFQLVEIVGSVGIPIALYLLLGALLGSFLLIGLGIVFYFRPNLLQGSLVSERLNKTTGILYLVVGVIYFLDWL
jgi:hypothetical protein